MKQSIITLSRISAVFAALLCGAMASLPAHAQRTKSIVPELDAEGHRGEMARAAQQKANERFDKADANKDGKISKDEAMAVMPYVGNNFGQYDKNGDGQLTWEEYIGHDKWERTPAK